MVDPNENQTPKEKPVEHGDAWVRGEEETRRKILGSKLAEVAARNSAALKEMTVDPEPTIRSIEQAEEVE